MTGLEGVEYALTLWRPWHALMLAGPKDIENRPWAPPGWIIGKRIALHAGLKFDEAGWLKAQQICADVGFNPFASKEFGRMCEVSGAIAGTAVVTGFDTKGGGNPWFFGPFGWTLEERRPLPAAIPCRGFQKLWRIPAELRG